jgi:transcriptional regulator with XRE-family HTH domain
MLSVKNPVDAHVGRRIRVARLAAGLSQQQLGEALGLTFQQVQKYEKGVNRVGASRVHAIARILSVPESYFFEQAGGTDVSSVVNPGFQAMTDALSTPEGIRIARALSKIGDANTRRRLADLLEAIIEGREHKAA